MPQDTLHFTTEEAFRQFLDSRPQLGSAFDGAKLDETFDITNTQFLDMTMMTIEFEGHEKVWLWMHPNTNEVVVADMNTAGHGARSRIVRIDREDIFARPADIVEWYDDWARKIWTG